MISGGEIRCYSCCENFPRMKGSEMSSVLLGRLYSQAKITAWLTFFLLFCLDSPALFMLNEQQFYLFGQIETSQTCSESYNNSSNCSKVWVYSVVEHRFHKENFMVLFNQNLNKVIVVNKCFLSFSLNTPILYLLLFNYESYFSFSSTLSNMNVVT